MVPVWTVPLSYFASAAMLAVGAAVWIASLFDHIVYRRVELGRLDQSWLDFSQVLMRGMHVATWIAAACALAAFVLAILPAGEGAPVAKTHKLYQLKFGAIALCFVMLVALARGRMGGFDADVGAAVLFAWALWIVWAGWSGFGGGAAVSGPTLWWLALAADVLAIAGGGFLIVMIEIHGFRMF